jgi:hypothetical protein
MAKKYLAATEIHFGGKDKDGNYEKKIFNVDDEVKGLSADDMKGLWKSGALKEAEGGTDEAKASEDSTTTSAGDQSQTGKAGSRASTSK